MIIEFGSTCTVTSSLVHVTRTQRAQEH